MADQGVEEVLDVTMVTSAGYQEREPLRFIAAALAAPSARCSQQRAVEDRAWAHLDVTVVTSAGCQEREPRRFITAALATSSAQRTQRRAVEEPARAKEAVQAALAARAPAMCNGWRVKPDGMTCSSEQQ